MKHALINITLFAGIMAAMVGIQGIDNHSEEHEVAKQELAKQRQQERFDKAAREVCGENSSYALTTNRDSIICKTKRGHRTGQVAQL